MLGSIAERLSVTDYIRSVSSWLNRVFPPTLIMSSGDRDWANLPPELLGSIAQRLTVVDYIRFGAVCFSWSSAASLKDRIYLPLAPQIPFLLHLDDKDEWDVSCTLVSFPDRRSRRLAEVFGMRGKWCIGSQDGWLALLDEESEVSLFNPLTRAQIYLPSVTTFPQVKPIYHFRFRYSPAELRCISFKKIVLSSRPTAGSYTAMAIFTGLLVPAFAKSGEEKWTHLRDGPSITDIIYRDGKFLGISDCGELWAFDVTEPSPKMTVIATACDNNRIGTDKYLVDSAGDLLQVWRRYSHDRRMTQFVKVMKFDPAHATWITLKSLDNNSLFLGLCYSVSLSAREISELKPNCIYFTESRWDWLSGEDHEERLITRDVCVFNLEDESFDRYQPPDPRLNWPPPIWFAPSYL